DRQLSYFEHPDSGRLHPDDGLTCAKKLYASALEIGDRELIGRTQLLIGQHTLAQSDYGAALTYLEDAMKNFEGAHDLKALAGAHRSLGTAYMLQERFTESSKEYEKAAR